jgi:hypothetical protein
VAHPNAVSFPVIMLDSIVASPFFDNDPTAYERAIGVIFVYAIGWNIIFYSFTYPFIVGSRREEPDQITTPAGVAPPAAATHDEDAAVPATPVSSGFLFACKNIMMNPNMIATFASLIIAFWPALKYQLFTPGTVLRPLMQAVEFIGNGAIPLSSLVMAGNVAESLRRNFGIGGPKDRDVELAEEQAKLEAQRSAVDANADSAATGAGSPTTRPLHPLVFTGRASSGYNQFHDDHDHEHGGKDRFADVEVGHTALPAGAAAAGAGTGLRSAPGSAVAAGVIAGSPVYSLNAGGDTTDDDDTAAAARRRRRTGATGATSARAGEPIEATLDALSSGTDGVTLTEIRLERAVSQQPGAGVIAAPLNVTVRTVHLPPGAAHAPPLPSPRLPMLQMAVFIALRLVVVPTCCFLLLQLADLAGASWIAPKDPLLRIMLLLVNLAPSAESVLVVITKTGMRRQALASSLAYLIQFGVVIVTATVGLTVALILYF